MRIADAPCRRRRPALFLRHRHQESEEQRMRVKGAQILILTIILAIACANPVLARGSSFHSSRAQSAQQPAAQTDIVKPVGTIKAISGNQITLTTESGSDVDLVVQDSTRILRAMPGQKDLSGAKPLKMQDLQLGDRVLGRGKPSTDGKAVVAISIIAMKKSDIEAQQQAERDDWAKRGIGGIVSGVDLAAGSLTISTSSIAAAKTITIHVSKTTVVRRYAPESVKFDDAKLSTLDQIKPGDQLRARGTRSADGSEFAAEEIVSGIFLYVAGPISAVNAAANALTVMDLKTKKPIVVKITADSQLRQIPEAMAQRIAMRFKGGAASAQQNGAPATANTSAGAGSQPPSSVPGGMPRSNGGGAADLQQMLSRLPAVSLADLTKGDVVMIVTTPGDSSG